MRHSTRITAIALAGAFALATLAAPASATILPAGVDTDVSAFNGNRFPVCVPGLKAAGVGVAVPIGSSEQSGCIQR
ncbi:hypothetical protein [Nonomuraea candida]|uniref:hypothetical protein n=1 Tax=Nonomuraea candida TaxID=359159 RepID=UPI0005B8BABD|nr:hypothetical protein [Nonomuraea candida]